MFRFEIGSRALHHDAGEGWSTFRGGWYRARGASLWSALLAFLRPETL